MKRTYKNVISFGIDETTARSIDAETLNKIINHSAQTWKIFLKKQGNLIRIVDDPDEMKKSVGHDINKFIIQYPRSTEDATISAFSRKEALSAGQGLYRDDGTALLMDKEHEIELHYAGAWQIIFKKMTGQSFLEKLGLKSEESLNAWVLEKSLNIKQTLRPELFLYNYFK